MQELILPANLRDRCLKDYPVKDFTTFKIGGTARYIFLPESLSELWQTIYWVQEQTLDYFILSGGSNVLIGDGYYDGAIILMQKIGHLERKENVIIAEPGVSNTYLAEKAAEYSLSGFEFLYRLPGCIGGSTVMNAKCYNGEMASIVLKVDAMDNQGQIHTFDHSSIGFGYKKTVFQENGLIVVKVMMQGKPDDPASIRYRMREIATDRRNRHQFDYPSAGCVFKNDYDLGIPSGKLIDDLGLKGKQIGDAQVSHHHANFIINKGQAKANDVKSLMQDIQTAVQAKYNVELQNEIKFYGSF